MIIIQRLLQILDKFITQFGQSSGPFFFGERYSYVEVGTLWDMRQDARWTGCQGCSGQPDMAALQFNWLLGAAANFRQATWREDLCR